MRCLDSIVGDTRIINLVGTLIPENFPLWSGHGNAVMRRNIPELGV